MSPIEQNRERALALARQIIEYLAVVPDVTIADCCSDHAIDQVLEVLIPELSAKDEEIERQREEIKYAAALANKHATESNGYMNRWQEAKRHATTARADAIRECANAIKSMVSEASILLRIIEAEGEPGEAQEQRAVQLTLAKAVTTLESLLNGKKQSDVTEPEE